MLRSAKTLIWRALALTFLVLGIIGAFLPLLPTVPFVIAAAWCASKGWPALEAWLLDHPVFGHSIRQWRDHGAVPRRGKWLATLMMTASAVLLQFLPLPDWANWSRWVMPLFFLLVIAWLWTRPERAPTTAQEKNP